MTRTQRWLRNPWLLAFCAAASLALVWSLRERAQSQGAPPPLPSAVTPPGAEGSTDPEQESAPDVLSPNVTITISVVPSAIATVNWGSQRLGKIEPGKPLVVTRPRDSGPLDITIRPNGFLSVNTRAHTFSSHRLQVRLTKPDQTATLLGYRVPLDAGASLDSSDGGVPPDLLP